MPPPVRILHLEDNQHDAEIIREQLKADGLVCDITWVTSREGFEKALAGSPAYDIVLLDYNLGGYDGFSAMKLAREKLSATPMIMVSGTLQPEEAVMSLKRGATDYLLKQRLERLAPAVQRAMEEAKEHRERLRAEQALRESEERFRQLAENINETFWMTDLAKTRLIYVSPAYETIWGRTCASLYASPRDWAEAIHPDDRERIFRAAYDNQPNIHYDEEFRIIRPDGKVRWIHDRAFPVRDEKGNTYRIAGVARDVTDRKTEEAARRESEQRLRLALEASGQGTWDLDVRTNKATVSRQLAAMLGYAADAFNEDRHSFLQRLHPDDREKFYSAYEACLRGEVPVFSAEFRLRTRPGTWKWIHSIGKIVGRDAAGQPLRMIGTHTDIDERKEAMAALEYATQELKDAKSALEAERTQLAERVIERTKELSVANVHLERISKLKDEFLANMSHELRTPLNAILGLSEALLEQIGGTLNPRQIKSITTISTSGQHLLALINDILDLSKIEAGAFDLYVEPVKLEELCRTSLVFVQTQAAKKQISVAFETDGRVATLEGDPKRLKQLLVNLLTNAVKFTPPGGSVGLTVSATEDAREVRFTVWDTGVGISADDQKKLFRAFTQIDSGLNRAQEGTGLGLALVGKLAELHHGRVQLESTPGKGSRFTVTVPVKTVFGIGQGATDPAAPLPILRRALVAEDDPMIGEMLVACLNEQGFRCTLIGHGDEVLKVAGRERPDIITLDVILPGEGGWEVLRQLKANPDTRDIPVLIVSGMNTPEKSLGLGAVAHITKPFKIVEFRDFLRTLAPPKEASLAPFVPAALAPPAAPPPGEKNGALILLAEDNEASIQAIGGYLEDKGYQMRFAATGRSAVKLAREIRPAVILMDIQMPAMDGLSAIKEMSRDAALKDIPIVALTALAMPGDRERCLAAGATDYMSKPVKLRVLAERIAGLLSSNGKGHRR